MSKTLGIIMTLVGVLLIVFGVLNHYVLYIPIKHLALFVSVPGVMLVGIGFAVFLLASQTKEPLGTPVRMGAEAEAVAVAATPQQDDVTLPATETK